MRSDITLEESLKKYLNQKAYPKNCIRQGSYLYGKSRYPRIEVLDKQRRIIQSYVLMSREHFEIITEFSFHRSYRQKNPFGTVVNPSCAIAVCEKGSDNWRFYSSLDLTEYDRDTYVNYRLARRRFDCRYGSRSLSIIRFVAYSLLFIGVAYFILAVLSLNGDLGDIIIPLNGATITLFVLISSCALLPLLFPYIKGFRLPGFGVDFKETDTK